MTIPKPEMGARAFLARLRAEVDFRRALAVARFTIREGRARLRALPARHFADRSQERMAQALRVKVRAAHEFLSRLGQIPAPQPWELD